MLQSQLNIIKMIHNEFDSSTDSILEETNKILEEANKKDSEKAQRLQSIGFINTAIVKDFEKIKQLSTEAEEKVKLMKEYQDNYPNVKFITEEKVKEICNKYKLICVPVSSYKGNVPNKNLKEIESFHLLNKHEAPDLIKIIKGYYQGRDYSVFQRLAAKKLHLKENCEYFESDNPYLYINNYRTKPNFRGTDKRLFWITKFRRFNRKGLQICAPATQVNIKGLKKLKSLSFLNFTEESFPSNDPIVLQPVKKGYLIISKWGLEENIDEVL